MRYLSRRIAHALLLLAVVSVFTFLLFQLAPGEFVSEMRLSPTTSPETIRAWRAHYGADLPLPQRYARWATSALKGDFGPSFAYNVPTGKLLRDRAANTLLLTLASTIIAWAIAVPLAVWTAARRNRIVDQSFGIATSALLSVPEVLIAFAAIVLASQSGLFPVGGMKSASFDQLTLAAKARDIAGHLLLPASTIVLSMLPMIVRHARSTVLQVIDAPFVQAARGHGLSQRTILFRYVLRAAANPLISLLGFSIATLLSGSLLVEVIMGWPGIGPLLLEAILARDVNVVLGAVIVSTVFLVGGNLFADILIYATDPRIREAPL